jgi:hypothetical protein
MSDAPRTVSVYLAGLGMTEGAYLAREFWTGEISRVDGATFSRTVAPHTTQLFALRPLTGRPSYLGGNRHVLQGAVEVRALDWDAGAKVLTMRYDAAPGSAKAPFEHHLDFHLPPGWSLSSATVSGSTAGGPTTTTSAPGVEGEILGLQFSVPSRQELEITLAFSGP